MSCSFWIVFSYAPFMIAQFTVTNLAGELAVLGARAFNASCLACMNESQVETA